MSSWECYPTRIKGLNFLKVPGYVIWALNLFRSFMSVKLKSRMFISKETIEDPKLLPKELGGKTETYETLAKYWKQTLQDNVDFFKELNRYKSLDE